MSTTGRQRCSELLGNQQLQGNGDTGPGVGEIASSLVAGNRSWHPSDAPFLILSILIATTLPILFEIVIAFKNSFIFSQLICLFLRDFTNAKRTKTFRLPLSKGAQQNRLKIGKKK
jgi:hypothetical protein